MKKPIKQMTKEDFKLIDSVMLDESLSDEIKEQQKSYWKKRVIERYNYIKPVVDECAEKKLDLFTVSSGLYEDWIQLLFCIEKYNFK